MISTSTTSLDLARQKNNEIHIPSPTIVSHIPSVRNTSPNLPTNYSSPRTNSLNHNTINSFPPTSNLLNHLPTHFQSKPIHISIPISTLQIANDHQLVTNSTIINTISVIDSKHSTKKSSAFPRKFFYLLLLSNIFLIYSRILPTPYSPNNPTPVGGISYYTNNDIFRYVLYVVSYRICLVLYCYDRST